jgi:hypothetical protein
MAPVLTAAQSACIAPAISSTLSILGIENRTTRDFIGGIRRSMTKRAAVRSPSRAVFDTTSAIFLMSFDNMFSASIVARFRLPVGRPGFDRGEDVDREAVRLRKVDGGELDAGLHQPGYEVDVAGETVEFGDDERGAERAARLERSGELRPIRPLAGLDLGSFGRSDRLPDSTSAPSADPTACRTRPRLCPPVVPTSPL